MNGRLERRHLEIPRHDVTFIRQCLIEKNARFVDPLR